jgi:hypothetical protein
MLGKSAQPRRRRRESVPLAEAKRERAADAAKKKRAADAAWLKSHGGTRMTARKRRIQKVERWREDGMDTAKKLGWW